MTIIKNGSALHHYPFQVIDAEALNSLRTAMDGKPGVEVTLKLLEAFCHLSKVTLSYAVLKSESFEDIARGFIATLADDFLYGSIAEHRTRIAGFFGHAIRVLHTDGTTTFTLDKKECYPKQNATYSSLSDSALDPNTLRYWNCWAVQSRKGKDSYIAIPSLWNKFGIEFAESTYSNYKNNFEKMARPETSELNSLIRFICRAESPWSPDSFQCPVEIRKLFTSFMVEWFTEAATQKKHLYCYIRRYSKFIHFLNEAFLAGGIWAKPFLGGLPAPSSIGRNQESNIRTNSRGQLINQKLITDIPLHLTDGAAIEILFSQLRTDVDLAQQWAMGRVKKLRKAQLLRDHLSKYGAPFTPSPRLISDLERITPENLAATLDTFGLEYIRKTVASRSGFKHRISARQISCHLALPRPEDILAFKILLIHHCQSLTDTALDELELYDKNGNLSGFIKTNHGYQLVTYKDRRGANRSQMFTDLTPRLAVLVRQLIEITDILRRELKKDGNDNWRYLLLHSPRELSYPSKISTSSPISRTPSSLDLSIKEFSNYSQLPTKEIENVVRRLTPTTYRASCAVANYLEHKDLRAFAQALGHSEYRPSLIKKYLPEPILDFLQSRWIRVFQKGMLCLALRESHLLLQASRFDSIDQLHGFLAAHTLDAIPEHLEQAAAPTSAYQFEDKKILISIDRPILNILHNIEKHVHDEPNTWGMSGKARYWADFSRLLTLEIESGWDPDMKRHLRAANSSTYMVDISNVFRRK